MDVVKVRRGRGPKPKKKKKKKKGMSDTQVRALIERRKLREKQERVQAARAEAAAYPKPRTWTRFGVLPDGEHLLEAVADPYNLNLARMRAARNRGAGVDGVQPADLPVLVPDTSLIREDLLAGTYTPSPVRVAAVATKSRVNSPTGVLTAADLLVQRALIQVLRQYFHAAWGILLDTAQETQWVRQCSEAANNGMVWVGRFGIAGWEDAALPADMRGLLGRYIPDARVVDLILRFLAADRVQHGRATNIPVGLLTAGMLGYLNRFLILRELDEELRAAVSPFVRYDTQLLLFASSRPQAERLLESAQQTLSEKAIVALTARNAQSVHLSGVMFLGFGFFRQGGSWYARRLPTPTPQEYHWAYEDSDPLRVTLPDGFGEM